MKKPELTQLTNEELQIKAKKDKAAFNAFISIFGILVGVSIYLTLQNGFSIFTMLPIVFIALIVAMKTSLNAIKKEIKSRKI